MNDSLNPVTLALVRNALDVASLRQTVHAHNIANANTPGFAPMRVSFDNSLEQARRRLDEERQGHASMVEAALVHDEGTQVDLIGEISAMSSNSLQYQALIRALNKEMSIATMALSEGRK